MRLLVSVIDEKEAPEAIHGGADIIDVKNPEEGSLGASFPHIVRRVREVTPSNIEVSAAIGDLPNLPGTASLAALGVATCGVDYVKAGLYGVKTIDETVKLMKEVCRSVKDYDPSIKVVAAGYADFDKIGSINPLLLPRIAEETGADVVMIDVRDKRSGKLFDFLTHDELVGFAREAHDEGLIVALAGSLGVEDIQAVMEIGADVFGVRGAACKGRDRLRGRVDRKLVLEISKAIRSLKRSPVQ